MKSKTILWEQQNIVKNTKYTENKTKKRIWKKSIEKCVRRRQTKTDKSSKNYPEAQKIVINIKRIIINCLWVIFFWEEISACAEVHISCYGRVRSCAIHNSFALYGWDAIHTCHTNKAGCQWTQTLSNPIT